MSLAALAVDFDPRWVVHRDEHFVVVDKPPGMVFIEHEVGGSQSLVTRLERWLGRTGIPVLSRLDRETSGLVAFPLSEAALAGMARASASGLVEKRYIAAVELRPGAALPRGVMDDRIAWRDGRAEVVRTGGEHALARVSVLASFGRRALLEVRLVTGRRHQIRAQLAHRGVPIGGDVAYGADVAPRLMLASVGLEVPHPVRGRLVCERPVPDVFEAWAKGALDETRAFEVALGASVERRHGLLAGLARSRETTAFRLVAEHCDGAPGVAVDVYDEHLVVHLLEPPFEETKVLDAIEALGARGIYVKRRPRLARNLAASDLERFAPSQPVRGQPASAEMVIFENGMPFFVRLGDGLGTGLYLDQRDNRAWVRAHAKHKRLLNLFAYTCGFTVAAALGGAAETVSIDASARALERGAANLELAGVAHEFHRPIVGDVFEALARMARRGERFELVCVDPPTFSTTKRGRWTSGRDWVRLAEAVFRVTAPGGVVLASSNDRRMTLGAFRAYLRAGAERARTELVRLVDRPPPLDFRGGPRDNPLLKTVLAFRGD